MVACAVYYAVGAVAGPVIADKMVKTGGIIGPAEVAVIREYPLAEVISPVSILVEH